MGATNTGFHLCLAGFTWAIVTPLKGHLMFTKIKNLFWAAAESLDDMLSEMDTIFNI